MMFQLHIIVHTHGSDFCQRLIKQKYISTFSLISCLKKIKENTKNNFKKAKHRDISHWICCQISHFRIYVFQPLRR